MRRPKVLAILAVAGALLAGCAAGSSPEPAPSATTTGPSASPSATPSPAPSPQQSDTSPAAEIVAEMTVAERAATVVMGHVPTTDAAALGKYMSQNELGGFILMEANVPGSSAELRALTDALVSDPELPPLIAIDEEGGDVARLPWDTAASALELKERPAEETSAAFGERGAMLAEAGVGVNFGVVADVARDDGSFIYRRSFGTDPASAAERVGAAVAGEEKFVRSTLKHFPGHGAAAGDSHAAIPQTDLPLEQWRSIDAVPFKSGVDAGAPLVMTGHLRFTAVDTAPASLSPAWYRILREDLGFTGVAVTDDLGMLQSSGEPAYADPVRNAVSAIGAGADLALAVVGSTEQTAPGMAAGIADAVDSGELPAGRLEEAATRVVALRLSLSEG